MKEYLIAHDLGTSGDKASLFSTEGELVCSYTAPYDVHYFHKNCAEQNPDDWWQAVCTATAKITEGIDPSRVLALSFSAQMQCCLPVDKEGSPLHPAMIWADQRAGQQRPGPDALHQGGLRRGRWTLLRSGCGLYPSRRALPHLRHLSLDRWNNTGSIYR